MSAVFDIPNPDDLVKDLLREMFGPAAAITIAFIVANAAWSWYGAVKSGAKFARRSYAAASQTSRRLRRMPTVAVVLGVVTTVVLLMLQVTWLWTSYIVGNGISYLFTANVPMEGPQWGTVLGSLRWDDITVGYVAASILAIVVSYGLAYGGKSTSWVAIAISSPAIFWGALTALGSALALLVATLYWFSDDRFEIDKNGFSMILLFVLAVMHISACFATMSTPGLIFRIWKTDEMHEYS